jgi:hypothetical protein
LNEPIVTRARRQSGKIPPRLGDNGGPPLDDPPPYEPEWGKGEIGRFYEWRAAHRRAWQKSPDIALRHNEAAEALGLTYEEYSLELLERGRHPQPEDVEAIKLKRLQRRRDGGVVARSLKGMRLK